MVSPGNVDHEIFHFKKQKKVIRGRRESCHGKSTRDAHQGMRLERMELRLPVVAYEGKRNFTACVPEGSSAS